MESTLQKIIRKTGMKPISCKCQLCKNQCKLPCIGTPEDIEAIKNAGFTERLETAIDDGVVITKPKFDKQKNACTFFTNGLCELHDSGLKPTVGKLSHHTTTKIPKYTNSIHYQVLRTWQK